MIAEHPKQGGNLQIAILSLSLYSMKTQDVLIVHPQTDEQANVLTTVMQALKIKFEVSKSAGYNPDFVKKALDGRKQAKEGKVTRVKKENLKEFLGI